MCAPVAVTTAVGIGTGGAVLMSQLMALGILAGVFIVNFRDNLKQTVKA
ncbi:MAG: hypothetical protein KAT65_30800 [Methanophagales archaeon]|nr:hypothetical protein [Methanophagales archaeon]